jgi:hypothetical protein
MCPTYQIHVISHKEFINDRLAEAIADPSLIILPVQSGIGWVRPQQVIEKTIVWNVCWPLYAFYIVHGMQ